MRLTSGLEEQDFLPYVELSLYYITLFWNAREISGRPGHVPWREVSSHLIALIVGIYKNMLYIIHIKIFVISASFSFLIINGVGPILKPSSSSLASFPKHSFLPGFQDIPPIPKKGTLYKSSIIERVVLTKHMTKEVPTEFRYFKFPLFDKKIFPYLYPVVNRLLKAVERAIRWAIRRRKEGRV